MRKALNENPLVQVGAIAALGIVVVFLFMTRMGGNEPPPEETETPATATETPAVSSTVTPPATDAATPATPSVPDATATAATDFKAGPGLPADLVDAYDDGKVVTLLVVRAGGIDDKRVRSTVESLRSRSDTAVFVTNAAGIAKYSRIAQGVDVERVPAMIVLDARSATEGDVPVAAVSYGFQGPGSIDQALRDARYDGAADLGYHP